MKVRPSISGLGSRWAHALTGRWLVGLLLCGAGIDVALAAAPAVLVWDATQKESRPAPGVFDVPFTFHVTNVSRQDVFLKAVRTSCGCTSARLPAEPYRLGPGRVAPVQVTLDLRGRGGTLFKAVTVETSVGDQIIWALAEIPPETTAGSFITTGKGSASGPNPGASPGTVAGTNRTLVGGPTMVNADRERNLRTAKSDRQAVFKGDCRRCHVEPAREQYGRALYVAACGICHDAPHRNAVVPDLHQPRGVRDLRFWTTWITEGRAGTLMPAFGPAAGGPLTRDQIDSLAVYLLTTFPRVPRSAGVAPPPGGHP